MKLKYIAVSLGIAMTALTSCNDFLDVVPDTRVYLSNVEQLRELMVDGYMSTGYANVCELSSDNVIDNNSPSVSEVIYNKRAFSIADNQIYAWEDVTLANDNDTPSGLWSGCYSAIAVCNAVMEKIELWETDGTYEALTPTDQAKFKAVKGEALLSRAFHHWLLCNVFCMPYGSAADNQKNVGIPYVTKPETTVKPHYERGTVGQDYEMIEKDLLAGLDLVDDQFYEVPKYHFNKAAAHAFAARFYLFKREYDKVVAHANEAFKGNDPKTLMNDIWNKTNFYYISDMGRYFTSVDRPGVMLCMSGYTSFWRRFVSSGRYACNRDAKRATIQGPGPSWYRCQYINSKKQSFAMHPAFNGFCGTAGGQEYGAYFAGNAFEQFEYTDKLAGIGYTHGVRAEFTAEETLLCRAEAYLFLGNIDAAFADLKVWDDAHRTDAVRAKDDRTQELTKDLIVGFYSKDGHVYDGSDGETPGYGIMVDFNIDRVCPSDKYHVTPEILPYLECVQHYRRIETVHTGMRWFDIKRYGLSIPRKIGPYGRDTLQVLDPRYAIQVPYDAISAGLDSTRRVSTAAPISSQAAVRPSEYKQVNF